jgi:hypothetical protein
MFLKKISVNIHQTTRRHTPDIHNLDASVRTLNLTSADDYLGF